MDEEELRLQLLARFPKEDAGCEWKEFKCLTHSVGGNQGADIISYVSAIANMNGGHLVIGVKDKSLAIVGIADFHDYTADNICQRILGRCLYLNSEEFRVEEHVTDDTRLVVWIIHIPKHDPRLPVYAHGKAWQRLGDSIVPMRPERLKSILSESVEQQDWSAVIVEGATVADLDRHALSIAQEKFKERKANEPWHAEIDSWEWSEFLDKAKLTANGKLTRAAILLLGKPTSTHYLTPNPAQITWKLDADDQAYEHFGPPFILATSAVLKRVRNVPYKLFPNNQLIAVEIQKYDTRVILEGLHNCIAHQDYEQQTRVLVTERSDRLIFENAGSFFEGKAEDYFKGTRTPRRYRNNWLAHAMVEVNMIDTLGYGIHSMIKSQRSRYLPLPDYRQSTDTSVVLEILGRPIDEKYSQLLLERRDLDIDTVILLDRVQKRLPITDEAASRLRRDGLIEGRRPNLHVSASIAAATETEANYSHVKGTEKSRLKELLIAHMRDKLEGTVRPDINQLLFQLLPAALSEKQRRDKVTNLLSEMKTKDGSIASVGRGPGARWYVVTQAARE